LNKGELVEEIARRTEVEPVMVAAVVDSLIHVVTTTVARGDRVVLSGFGTFHRQLRARRTARNISTGQSLTVPARNIPAFRPGAPFREVVGRRRGTRRAAPKQAARRSRR
jgi:DNA-binding protein HU-beta